MKERRTETRMLCADLVEVLWQDKSGRGRHAVANLEDISSSGICLQLDGPLPLDIEVRVQYPGGEFSGRVRYCQFRDIGYFAGVRFENGTKWSKTRFRPLHLLDPRTLTGRARPAGAALNGPAAG